MAHATENNQIEERIDQRCCDCIMVNVRFEISTSHIMVGYVLSVSQRPINACTSPSRQTMTASAILQIAVEESK